jgi:hypothetical protein
MKLGMVLISGMRTLNRDLITYRFFDDSTMSEETEIAELRRLCRQAADALEGLFMEDFDNDYKKYPQLFEKLREAGTPTNER